MYLSELLKQNGHKLTHYTKAVCGHTYMSIFNYSNKYGGTIDGFRYYNDYVIDVSEAAQ